MTGMRATAMDYSGMTREAMKEAVTKQLEVGQQYVLISEREENKERKSKGFVRCTLMSFGKNTSVFKQQDGTMESFTYQDICIMLMAGKLK